MAATRVRYGQRRIYVLLRREGWLVNVKRVARIYLEEGLAIRTKMPRRRRAAIVRKYVPERTAPNQSWAMDFIHDVLADGSKIPLLTIVDTYSRESLALEVAYGFKSPQVVDVLRRIVAERGAPERIHCDNGPDSFPCTSISGLIGLTSSSTSRVQVAPQTTPFANRSTTVSVRVLNPNWFITLAEAQAKAAAWRHDYNANYPHSSLGDLSPEEFARRCANSSLKAAISGAPAD
jgi:putative transposase